MTFGYSLLLSVTVLALPIVSANFAPIDSIVVCVDASWRDLCLFLLTKYVAHAATTLSTPGGKFHDSLAWRIVAVLLPSASWSRSLEFCSKWIGAKGWKDNLHWAWGGGALMVVTRTRTWKPGYASAQGKLLARLPRTWSTYNYALDQLPSGYQTAKRPVDDAASLFIDGEQIKYWPIHGKMNELPEGYGLAFFEVKNIFMDELKGRRRNWLLQEVDLVYDDPRNADIKLAHTRHWMAMLISIVQLVASMITLYRTRGDQIACFGYAAFGLSVIPFMLMSFMNLVFNAVLGDFPHVLRTGVLEESERCLPQETWYEGVWGIIPMLQLMTGQVCALKCICGRRTMVKSSS
ncbi:hypothetical protein NEOLEDRAFT_477161 [Neolentinus lepideus HHB14362 ss-1]|uniref:Glycosyltransferase 2-like domain-containing protein n=1 Tax=Neolentinus lepideus HHB14362 ss-1 TaxID=1314782 RepID=A0A165VKN8_9AGAM|nr:hypothetical protein NEOLEDRAFT_477161 [Neolentinus lepideus HHB14362 ss-1]